MSSTASEVHHLVKAADNHCNNLAYLRRKELSDIVSSIPELAWQDRTYNVLSIISPALSSHENKIEFPGDPMCIYTALSYPIQQVAETRKVFLTNFFDFPEKVLGNYNDLCPAWGYLPDIKYRNLISRSLKPPMDLQRLNTDQLVFDPRVWNKKSEIHLCRLLSQLDPKVVLISSVSPALPYAIAIATIVKDLKPNCITILGGRHCDATIFFYQDPILYHAQSIPLLVKQDKISNVFNFVIAGEGYYSLDFLMKIISLSMDVRTRETSIGNITNLIQKNKNKLNHLPGKSAIISIDEDFDIIDFRISGKRTDIVSLPPPYRPFAIRARFPIFTDIDGRVLLTAHINTSHACPFDCGFCSESKKVVGQLLSFSNNKEHFRRIIEEYISYGAEAMFFDDSVLCAGNIEKMESLADAIIGLKEGESLQYMTDRLTKYSNGMHILSKLPWGAQLTVDIITTRQNRIEIENILEKMSSAGCNYIYLGLESLSNRVIDKIHKNTKPEDNTWPERVEEALQILRRHKIRVGCSLLFGLPGENNESIDETIKGVAHLVNRKLIFIASPNILTYHPSTAFSIMDGVDNKLDYTVAPNSVSPPYSFFEEAYPNWVSVRLTKSIVWEIHEKTQRLWGNEKNANLMQEPSFNNLKS